MSATAHPVDIRYRPDIDGLRAVAVLGVVAYHVGLPGITGGFVGVDVFFVLSGYLITQLLARELADTGTVSLRNFYARRMRRLLPALALVLLGTVALSWVLLPPAGEREELAQSALASLSFVANHFFMTNLDGYFAGAAERKPLLHLWSLAVEEQFYVMWPLVLLAIGWLTRGQARVVWMRWAIAAITLVSFIFSAWLVQRDQVAAFYAAPPRAWELGVGAFLALLPAGLCSDYPKAGRIASAFGVLLVLSSFALLESATRFPGPTAAPAVLGTALLIWGNAQGRETLTYRLLSSRVMVAIGVTSYGWYLWHWPLLAYLREVTLMRANVPSAVVAALLAYLLAALSLKYVETPVRHGAALRGAPTARVLQYGAAALVVLACVAALTWVWAAKAPRSAGAELAARVDNDTPAHANYECMIQMRAWSGNLPIQQCHFGTRERGPDFVIWGDSHASALTPLLLALQKNGAPSFLQLTMASCLPLAQQTSTNWNFGKHCADFNSRVLRELPQLKAQGLQGVIIAGRWLKLWDPTLPRSAAPPRPRGLRDFWRAWRSGSHAQPRVPADEMLTADLTVTAQKLQAAGLKVLVILDPPEYPQSLPSCAYFDYSDLSECGMSRAAYEAQAAPVRNTFMAVARRFPGFRVFDPTPYLCDKSRCPAFAADSRPIVSDEHHMSASTARSFAPVLAADFHWLQAQAPQSASVGDMSPGSR